MTVRPVIAGTVCGNVCRRERCGDGLTPSGISQFDGRKKMEKILRDYCLLVTREEQHVAVIDETVVGLEFP